VRREIARSMCHLNPSRTLIGRREPDRASDHRSRHTPWGSGSRGRRAFSVPLPRASPNAGPGRIRRKNLLDFETHGIVASHAAAASRDRSISIWPRRSDLIAPEARRLRMRRFTVVRRTPSISDSASWVSGRTSWSRRSRKCSSQRANLASTGCSAAHAARLKLSYNALT